MWLPDLAHVQGAQTGRMSDWVGSGQYYFDSAVSGGRMSFVLKPGDSLTEIFAAEMSRFASAAIETSVGIARPGMPKSTAWLFIQTYYSAFYAAHSILRSVGISATNFRRVDCQKADLVAELLGFSEEPINAAQFKCEYRSVSQRLDCNKASGKGIHEQFWRIFDGFLQSASSNVLQNDALPVEDTQDIFYRLDQIRSVLRSHGYNDGNWLSSIRNEVTYTQQHETWFPYGRSRKDCDMLFKLQKEWRNEPEKIHLRTDASDDPAKFVIACAFLVSLSISIVKDMGSRGIPRKSFLRSGALQLLNQTSER